MFRVAGQGLPVTDHATRTTVLALREEIFVGVIRFWLNCRFRE
jgi:hypothetical protein